MPFREACYLGWERAPNSGRRATRGARKTGERDRGVECAAREQSGRRQWTLRRSVWVIRAQGLIFYLNPGSPLEETLLRTAACLDGRLVVYQLAAVRRQLAVTLNSRPASRSSRALHAATRPPTTAGVNLCSPASCCPKTSAFQLLALIHSLAVSHAQVGDRFSRAQMMHNSPPSHQNRHFSLTHHTDSMLPSFSQQQQPQQSQHQHAITPSQTDLGNNIFDESQQQPQVRKRGGRGPGKKDVDRPSISVRWEEGDLTERLIQALERPDRQWHAVIAQVGPEHTRVVIGVPKRDLQREIARHLFANDQRYDLEDKRTIEPLAVSVKNKLFKIVNLYQDCERELSEWQGMFNDEREIVASNDPNVAAAWGRVKEKLPQFFRVRDLIKRTQTSGVATNSIPSSGQTSPTRATAQNPQVRGSTQAPQVPSPQTPRHPASGSLGESSTSATRPAMQNSGHAAATLGLNLSGQHSPATRTFVQQQPQQQHGTNMPFAYGMPQTPHIQQQLQQQQQQQAQQAQQQQQQQFQQSQAQAQHHPTHTHQRMHSQSQTHQAPHVLSMQHQRQYAAPSNAVSGPTSASAPSPSFPTSQNILTRSPALPPPPAPMAGSSSQRPPSGHRAVSVSRTTGGPSRASPVGRHSSSPSPPPPSPPLSVTKVMTFLDGYESRKRKREEDLFALKRMRYEERDKERAEREKQRQHERDMMQLRIELARTRHEREGEGENELDHLGLREAPG
ncbi:hypothetical protein BDV93DRAFT_328707 [Ceratobasidium sp. AG-I]|nr:hypothetical protein BDV93DRAFT_328707 [Ceratobasidium sp. AG-I]